jgi:hypothetical protein
MGRARARKIPAQVVEDEEYQLRPERVAGIDIAKGKAEPGGARPPGATGPDDAGAPPGAVPG